MRLEDLLAATVRVLEIEAIPYMLTGSIVSSMYGEPRSTLDIDVVIDPAPGALDRLVDRLADMGLDVDRAAATAAAAERGQFNALDRGDKVDFVIRKETPFSRSEFARRRRTRINDLEPYVVRPEDLLVVKLAWALETGSDRQLRDAGGILAISDDLDRGYVTRWADELGVGDAWRALLEADPGG